MATLTGTLPFTNNPVPSWNGRMPVISSGFRNPDRLDHIGTDIMYARLPSDGGPPGAAQPPNFSARYFMPSGIPALAAGPGKVVFAGIIGTGGHVKIDHAGGWRSEYMHLVGQPKVKEGQMVVGGESLGEIGYNPKDWHLIHKHFQLRKDGALVDPGPIVTALPVLAAPKGGALSTVLAIGLAAAFGIGVYYYFSRPATVSA